MKKFDVVTSFQVIEHVSDEVKFLEQVTGCLKPNGDPCCYQHLTGKRLLTAVQKPWNIYHKKNIQKK